MRKLQVFAPERLIDGESSEAAPFTSMVAAFMARADCTEEPALSTSADFSARASPEPVLPNTAFSDNSTEPACTSRLPAKSEESASFSTPAPILVSAASASAASPPLRLIDSAASSTAAVPCTVVTPLTEDTPAAESLPPSSTSPSTAAPSASDSVLPAATCTTAAPSPQVESAASFAVPALSFSKPP